jgi:anthranilate synthase component II
MAKHKILMIDNYDSFTYNLVQYLGELGQELLVYRNDALTLEQVKRLRPDRIVISPGPGSPKDAGISREVIREMGPIHHNRKGLFQGLPDPFEATRYHSLVVRREDFPKELEITAETKEKEIMGLRHRHHPIVGVQFHPESILTTSGMQLLRNFLKLQ